MLAQKSITKLNNGYFVVVGFVKIVNDRQYIIDLGKSNYRDQLMNYLNEHYTRDQKYNTIYKSTDFPVLPSGFNLVDEYFY